MKLSPLVSEFESEEQAASYERWLQDKVAQHLADTRAPLPHDQVMAELEGVIAEAEDKRKTA